MLSPFGSEEPFGIVLCLSSSSFVTMAKLIPHWVVNSDRSYPEEDRLREDSCYEALAFSRHIIDMEFEDETMRPQKTTETQE